MYPTPRHRLSFLRNSFASLHPILESLEIIEDDASINSPSLPISIRITAGHDMLVKCKTPVS